MSSLSVFPFGPLVPLPFHNNRKPPPRKPLIGVHAYARVSGDQKPIFPEGVYSKYMSSADFEIVCEFFHAPNDVESVSVNHEMMHDGSGRYSLKFRFWYPE